MFDFLKFQDNLAKKWKYRKLRKQLSIDIRKIYEDNIPEQLDINGDDSFIIKSKSGTLIANGYDRIVIGDYGAFIEISKDRCVKENIKCKEGQEYRYKDPNYSKNIKYYWYTAKDDSDIKIYYQQKTVTYADYKPNMIYISPYEILL